MSELVHTLDETLERFTLISGSGSEEANTACAMTALSWMRGEAWTDSMPCAHPLIRRNVINANDAATTTAEMRAELVRAGVDGVIDTWWVPTEVIVWALAQAPRDVSVYEQTLAAVRLVGEWKHTKQRPDLAGAYLAGAYLTRAYLAGAYLARADLTRANLTRADLTRANLTDANLADAYLAGAYLAGAYLTRAYLAGAYLARADLTRADLTRADLTDANLTDANLAGADLTRADLTRANLTDANLTGAYRPVDPPEGWQPNEAGLLVREAAQ